MSCPLKKEIIRANDGTITSYSFSLIKPINAAVLGKVKSNHRSTNTNLPRKAAFANVSILDSRNQAKLAKYLGTAVNKDELPDDLKAMFTEDGSVRVTDRHKIAYLGILDRENQNFKTEKKKGTFVLERNIDSVFGIKPKNISSNDVLKKYYLPDSETTVSQIQLVKGSASQLLNCLLGPTSPLHELGVEYIILHPVSRKLETNYYAKHFGFQPLLGMPQALLSVVMMDKPTKEDEESLVENFEYFGEAEPEFGGPEIKKWNNYYIRLLDDRVYQLYETETTGPIMYKKLADPEQPVSAKAQTVSARTEPISIRLTNTGKKPKKMTKKQIEHLLFNGAVPSRRTRKIHTPRKPNFGKGTRKRPQRG